MFSMIISFNLSLISLASMHVVQSYSKNKSLNRFCEHTLYTEYLIVLCYVLYGIMFAMELAIVTHVSLALKIFSNYQYTYLKQSEHIIKSTIEATLCLFDTAESHISHSSVVPQR